MHTPSATQDAGSTGWFKSSYSPSQSSCVEARFDGGAVQVRDSKNLRPGAGTPLITVSSTQWATFVETVRV